ncbi:MAG: bifunctional folylpolyglutamate synthase/dihydrofolate synthase [Lachnospiraceae bacterium]|nr:bifunctional folylpolyglutamate synthase/dihydrofolate synthase [Lachnospiraceae bacterium]
MGAKMEEIFETYGAAVNYINATPKFTTKNSMEDTARFWERLGYPAKNSKILHIAGTNGKGSVCAYLCSVLRKAGISCGMFTSPHLVSMRERFVINGEMVSEEDFLEAFRVVMGEVKRLATAYHPTFFELLFFMAMVLFEKHGVEYVVLETGLGGRLDATNVVEEKKLCILTAIGYDHMEYLGDTLPLIAGEKAGIMRPGVPVVYPDGQEDVTRVIEEYAEKIGTQTFPVEKTAIKEIKIRHKTIDFSLHLHYYDYIGFTVSTSALYQVENASLAANAIARLEEERITVSALQDGIREMVWEGRMEEILPSVYLDGAHNADGILAFLETVKQHACVGRRVLLYSTVRDKQYSRVAALLAQAGLFDEICLVPLQGERALPLTQLTDSFRQYTGFDRKTFETLDTALSELLTHKNDGDEVYIVGSLYLAGEVKALLRRFNND